MSLYLLPETETRHPGAGPAIETETDVADAVVTLGITQAHERVGLEVSIWGSPDGEDWGAKPLLVFPAKSYCGRYTIPLNLAGVRKVRAAWKMQHWTRNRDAPFGFYVELTAAGRAAAAASA
jgi:hypothetical protein